MPRRISRRAARARKLPRYFTGRPCSNGHIAERLTLDCHCVECAREASRRYGRTPKGRERQWRYRRSPKGYETNWRYDRSPKGQERRWRYSRTEAKAAADRRYQTSEKGRETRNARRRERLLDQVCATDPVRAARLIARRIKDGRIVGSKYQVPY